MSLTQLLAIVALRDGFWTRSAGLRWLRLGVFCGYLYVGALLVLLALENRMLFPGTTAAQDWTPPPPDMNVRSVELTSTDGTRLHAWWTAPPGWRPEVGAILFSHGNGGNLSGRGYALELWRTHLNRAVLIYDYPGYGRSEGKPTEQGCYAAGEAAYRWLVEEQKVPAGQIILLGSSLGSAIATDLAVRHDHRLLILISPFTSFPDMAQKVFPWLPARWLVRNRLDNLGKIGQVRAPVFIAHGTADGLVPFQQGERVFAAARDPKHFLPLVGQPHAHPIQPEFFAAVRAFLDETRTR